jgi:D-sedoheptulose 7-phosphate isomerase
MITDLNTYLLEVAQTLSQVPRQPLDRIAEAIWETYERDGTILICGNGGSAASASHFACDLAKLTISFDCRRVRAIALTDNLALMTAWSNDQGYADVFVEQLISIYRPGDLLFTISGSGNSPNVLRAVEWANDRGAPTVGLTGFDGGKLARMARLSLHVQNDIMPQVEDIHMTICHGLAVALKRRIADTALFTNALAGV